MGREVGVYVHIPFCVSRCKYCDFYSTTLLDLRHQYATAVATEAQDRISEGTPVRTIYFGGGTPSVLLTEDIALVLNTILSRSSIEPIEITLEANPGDLDIDKLRELRRFGINRLSIGIQSFNDEMLQRIGRRHNADEARQAVAMAKAAGFDNISIDLMYALPGQTIDDWKQQIYEALRLGVQHISAYCLSYEPNTVFGKLLASGLLSETDDETANQMADVLAEKLAANGFVHYEVSNFALPNYESRHNSSYWTNVPYIGLGAGAHSYDGATRSWNINDVNRYISDSLAHCLQPETETLTDDDKRMEQIMLGLRTNKGIELSAVDKAKADDYVRRGLLTIDNNRVIATRKGIHILNRIIEDLI
ncbi:MAG: radical SAM family heme chaperone HemW [Paludibacteraceae bacterium]|nr:radical SAM family heme chaperone HemW [Paludibacteraceae bacterium]